MKRNLLVAAIGLVGILLGIGASLAASALAGDDISQPVPLGIAPSATPTQAEKDGTGERDRSTGSATPTQDGSGGFSSTGDTSQGSSDGQTDDHSSDGSSSGAQEHGDD